MFPSARNSSAYFLSKPAQGGTSCKSPVSSPKGREQGYQSEHWDTCSSLPKLGKERKGTLWPLPSTTFISALICFIYPGIASILSQNRPVGPLQTPECYHRLSHKNHLQLMFAFKFANIAHTLPVSSSLFRPKQSKTTLLLQSLHCCDGHNLQKCVVHQSVAWEGLTGLSETKWGKMALEHPHAGSDPLHAIDLQVVRRSSGGPSAELGCMKLHPSLGVYEL